MNSLQIEISSINSLTERLNHTEYLVPYISKNDKEPTWDGNVEILSNNNSEKKNLKRVPVQVKGKYQKNLGDSAITYPIEIIDLKNYLNDGGVIFFIVYVTGKLHEYKIYYAQLEPVRIKEILDNLKSKNQKTKNVKLKSLPDDDLEIIALFLNFYENRKRQTSFIDNDLMTLDEMKKLHDDVEYKVTISGLNLNYNNMQKYLEQNNIYIYAELTNYPVPIPLSGQVVSIVKVENTNLVISSKNGPKYTKILREEVGNVVKLRFGKSFILIVNIEKRSLVNIDYNFTYNLREQIVDLSFILSMIKNKGFYINGIFINLYKINFIKGGFDLGEQEQWLQRCKRIESLLDYFSIEGDLDCSMLTDTEWNDLDILIDSVLDGNTVGPLKERIPCITLLKIGDYNLSLLFREEENKEGYYRIEDLFQVSMDETYLLRCIEDKKSKVPIFRALSSEQLAKASNIKFDLILRAYKVLESSSELLEDGNIMVLNLISAADIIISDTKKRLKFLDSALELIHWLQSKNREKNFEDILRINELQIIKRTRQFSDDEIDELITISSNTEKDYSVQFAVSVLLDNMLVAKRILQKLDEETKDLIKDFPIYNLYKSEP